MYPHGPDQKDYELRLEDTSFSYDQCLKINTDWTGFPFFTERHYKLYVSKVFLLETKQNDFPFNQYKFFALKVRGENFKENESNTAPIQGA